MTDHSRKHALLPSPVLFAVVAALLLIAPKIVGQGLEDYMDDWQSGSRSTSHESKTLGALLESKQILGADYTPGPTPVIWGDANKDRKIDLDDLALVGKHWDTATQRFGREKAELIEDLSSQWGLRVPLALHEIGWENRQAIASASSFPAFAKEQKKGGAGAFRAIGFGITYPKRKTDNPRSGLQVFTAPANQLTPVRFQGIRNGYDDSNDPNRRYSFPIQSEVTDFRYMNSFAEELDFRGLDINLEARYSVFSGGVRLNAKSSFYKSQKNHKVIFKSTRSYGWFFLPDQQMRANLTPGFIAALASPDSRSITNNYGEHYIFAEHRQGNLFIEVEFNTVTEKERQSFGASVKANFQGAVSSVQFASRIANLSTRDREITNLTVKLYRDGGPDNLCIPSGGDCLPIGQVLILDAQNPARLVETVGAIAGAWSTGLTADNAAATDIVSRPISDFFDANRELPFTRAYSLRSWFERFLEFDSQLDRLDAILDRDFEQPQFTREYRYFEKANSQNNPVPGAGQFSNWLEFITARDQLTRSRYASLMNIGRKMFEAVDSDEPILFDPRDQQYFLPRLPIPTFPIQLLDVGIRRKPIQFCDWSQWQGTLNINGATFTREDGYRWHVLTPSTLRPSRNGGFNQFIYFYPVAAEGATRITVAMLADSDGPDGQQPGCPDSSFMAWNNGGRPELGFALVDELTRQVISYACAGDCLTVDIPNFLGATYRY